MKFIITNDGGQYFKDIDTKDQDITFTNELKEACRFESQWEAESTIEFITRHFEGRKEINNLATNLAWDELE